MSFILNAQNLVVNPSFENIVGTLQCSWYTTQAQFDDAIDGWTCPTAGSTDIFSMSLDQSCYCHPLSTHASSPGNQVPRTGDVMSHVTVYGDGGCTPYREYLQGVLTTPLTAGQDYLIEFYVSLGDESTVATNNIGVYFTTTPVNSGSMCVYDVTPQLNNTTIITDDQNWTLISFTYTADAAYTNFMIGNFDYDVGTSTSPHTGTNGTVRYFVDDVSITEEDNDPPTSTFTVGTPVCVGENSNITYTGTGTAAATYHWSWDGGTAAPGTGQGPHTVNWATSGAHTVSLWVEENGLNSEVTSHVITVNEVPTSDFVMSNVDCFGDNSSIVYSGSGSSSATYNWDFDGGTIVSGSGQGPYEINWTNSGTHTVELTVEENGCASMTSHSLTVPAELQLTLDPTDATCFDADDGSIVSNVLGGTSPYSYYWNNSATSSSISGLAPGNYELQVTDDNGCVQTAIATIEEPDFVLITVGDDQDICFGDNVQLSAFAEGGNGSLSYYWNDGSGFQAGGMSEVFSPTASQVFQVYAEDANGCQSDIAEINVSVSPSMALDLTIDPISCNEFCDGSATLIVSGGISPYIYSGDMTSSTIHNLCPGVYNVTITDNNACEIDTFFVLNQPSPIFATVYSEDASCYGSHDGMAFVSANGGTPPYSYHWISGASNDTAINLGAGVAGVTITDSNGCVFTESAMVGQPSDIIIQGLGNRQICIGGTATNSIAVTGGTAPYSFEWLGDDGLEWYGNNLSVSPDEITTYGLTVTDANLCTKTGSMTVNVFPELSFLSLQADQDSVCKGESVTIYGQVEGGNGGPYEVSFDDQIVGFPYEFYPQNSGWHYLRLADACETPAARDSIYIHVWPAPQNNFISNKVAGCPTLNVQFTEINPDTGKAYFWQFGDGGFAYSQQTYHLYENSGWYDVRLTVTDENGCKNIKTIEDMIHIYPVPEVDFYVEPNEISMLNPLVYFYPVTANTDSLYWYFGDGDSTVNSHWGPSHYYDGIGKFEIELYATNNFGCENTIHKNINVREYFTFYAPTAFTPNFDGENDCFSVCGAGIDPNDFSLIIYDRWGAPVFDVNKYDKRYNCNGCGESSWDGTMQGNVTKGDELLPSGAYTWICKYKDLFGIEHFEQGVVRLIR